jgi:hypothetical protein
VRKSELTREKQRLIWEAVVSMFKKKQLTERQRDILEAVGLPAELDKLRKIQQTQIVLIEKKLKYLERRYQKKFYYNLEANGNKLNGIGETKVYAEGENPETDTFMIEDKTWLFPVRYNEHYHLLLLERKVQKQTEEEVSNLIHDQIYKVYTRILGKRRNTATAIELRMVIENTDEEYCDELFKRINDKIASKKEIDYIDMYCVDNGVVAELGDEKLTISKDDENVRMRYIYDYYNKNIGRPDCEKEILR